jgi:hypothetical protein
VDTIAYRIATDAPSRSFRLTANDHAVPVVETPPLDAAERQRRANEYLQLPTYCHIYDPACMHLHYAHLAAAGAVVVQVEASEEIRTFSIHPLRRRIEGRAAGRVLTFAAGEGTPRYRIVRINQLPPLMVVIDPPEVEPPLPGDAGVLDAAAFLSDPRGCSDQTPNFQRAFAAACAAGKTLYVPPGTYAVTQLHLRQVRGFQLYLAPGCLLRVMPSLGGENEHRHGLWLENCEDVAVTGRGCIDQQAYEHYVHGRNQYQHGLVDYYTANELCPWITQSPLFITDSRRIRVEDITIRNGRNFNLNCRNCDDLAVRRVKILTPPACSPEYADGINTGSCQNVLIEDCLVACNDDCFASGHYFATYDRRPSRNHVIRGMVGWNLRANAVRLGFYADQDQGDFTFENCDFLAMVGSTLLVHALRPGAAGRPSRYGMIRVVDCGFDDAPRLQSLLQVERAAVQEVQLVGVSFCGEPRCDAALCVEGDPDLPIGRLLLEGVSVDGKRVTDLGQVRARLTRVTAGVVR